MYFQYLDFLYVSSRVFYLLILDFIVNHLYVLFATLTNISITGTSTNTPTTVANAAPDCKPKSDIATATDNSKKLLAPIIPAGAAIL